ncbi:hypothetical protein BKA70DRAFT_1079882, partial [Coprinopsis sp. MPI-PUGE-AT-0042]
MPYCRIEPQVKQLALSLWERGFEAEDITDALGISQASLYRWQKILDEHGTVTRPSIRGQDRIISRAVMTAIYTLFENESDIYLDELVFWLAVQHDLVISKSALQATLARAGLSRKLLHKVAKERDAELRREW